MIAAIVKILVMVVVLPRKKHQELRTASVWQNMHGKIGLGLVLGPEKKRTKQMEPNKKNNPQPISTAYTAV